MAQELSWQLIMLAEHSDMAWFKQFLENLRFNAENERTALRLVDENVEWQSKRWEQEVPKLIALAGEDEALKAILRRSLELAPEVRTIWFGSVPAERYPRFCEASRELRKLILEIFASSGLDLCGLTYDVRQKGSVS